MLFADARLARRLEAAESANARECTTASDGTPAETLNVAGGCAVFAGVDSPLTQAVGLGLAGPVSAAEFTLMEGFFRSRGAAVRVDVCPLAHSSLLELLGAGNYRATEFNNVLAKQLAGTEILMTPRVRRTMLDERELWSHTVGRGFFETDELTDAEMNVGRAIFGMPAALCYLAVEEAEPVGAAAAAVREGLMTMFADSTLKRRRARGLHLEMIAARLGEGLAAGCDLACASTLPGSGSQRNYERMGFFVAYTKVVMVSG